MTLEELDAYADAKQAGTIRVVLIGGKPFAIDTRTADVKVFAIDQAAITTRRQELQAARQVALRRAQAIAGAIQSIDALLADILAAPSV